MAVQVTLKLTGLAAPAETVVEAVTPPEAVQFAASPLSVTV
jgi:hypothetical protein